jgi:uncharacterized protein (DUF1501 family)
MNYFDRRHLLKHLGAAALGSTPLGLTVGRVAFAAAPSTESRLVVVVLRGAVDGLALAPPYGEPAYGALRGQLALGKPGASNGVRKLDGLFGLHPSFEHVHALYQRNEALVVHAVASPYRGRSHFDGQDVLEAGSVGVDGTRSGWLNRALGVDTRNSGGAIALAHTVPLMLRGEASVSSYAPSRLPDTDEDTLRRLEKLYADDEFFQAQFEQALAARAIAARDKNEKKMRGGGAAAFKSVMEQTARFLSAPDGPRIAMTEADGWDTHANQGATAGNLARRFAALDAGLATLRDGLGEHWDTTAVLVVTEFGRTVRVNGTGGTDHGTGGAALLLGGAVAGGKVTADWPGLNTLYEDRDLMPTTDLRSVFKAALVEHLGLDEARVATQVFPHSRNAPVLPNLFKA